jgi:RNA polymerase sigma-70 factor (ECF subfamily)
MTTTDDVIIAGRPRLIRLAYRMLGSVSEAEDVVQDAYLRLTAQTPPPRTPAAWLTTVTTRLAIDRLRRVKARRETYPGPWLPEPIVTADEDAPEGDLSMGFLLMLERLSPEERAAFTLREAFGAPYAEIAAMLDKSEAAVRQIVSRARNRLQDGSRARPIAGSRHLEALHAFVASVAAGDADKVKSLLAADVQFVSDGGGRRSAALRIVQGREEVATLIHFLTGRDRIVRQIAPLTLNGAAGLLAIDEAGDPIAIQIAVSDAGIAAIYSWRNPEKLRHLVERAALPPPS